MKKILFTLLLSSMFATTAFAGGMPGMNIVTDSLNVRSTGLIGNNIIGSLKAGDKVKVLKVEGDWCQIEYKNVQQAYVACQYLKQSTTGEQTTAATITSTPVIQSPVLQPSSTTQSTDTSSTCSSLPILSFAILAPKQGEMKVVSMPVCGGWRYLACTQSPVGNPDLYGGATSPTTSIYGEKSTDTTMDDGSGNQVPRPDCIKFEPKNNGTHYLGIYGAADNSSASIWISSSPKNNVPEGFEKSLTWFSDTCVNLTNKEYGTFNSPWGNDGEPDRPFYVDYNDFIHGGADIACPANTAVKAMCDGTIKREDDAGGDWGWYTDLECTKGKNTITIAYIHINKDSVLPVGTEVKTGQTIATVLPMHVPGEVDHVHLTACNDAYEVCDAAGFKPQRGAARRTEWWGVRHYWIDMDWRSNPGLYKSLPKAK